MSKERKIRYIVELDVLLETFQLHILETRFEIARHISNACKGKMLENIALMRADEEYQSWLKKEKSEVRSAALGEIREKYDVSQTGAERIVKEMGKHFKQKKPNNSKHKQKIHLDSHLVQKIALQVWKSISDYLFGKGKKVHFKKYGQFDSVEGKNNKAGLTYENGVLYWNGLEMKVHIPMKDKYIQKALHDEITYCRLVRKTIRGQVKYYLQLVFKGTPPQKHKTCDGEVGLDIGISTIAAVSDKEVMIEEFCDGLEMMEKEKRRIFRKMDRSRRATNPNRYNENGTTKKGNRDKWIRSKHYWKQLFKLKEICRKIASVRKIMHNKLANTILNMGNQVYCEKMNYKGLQKTKFGKRIGYKAPSMFLSIVNKKLSYQGVKN
ncbi:transposase [Neobacillus cucumis]|uniref:transposase n=1 Tax=Neobacillus cucumis TaxID=1740721 RepID=UPI00203C6E22|nr:transposase [Neobacillus cucumis]MCM3727662.1 transposase [Neobacillus cucumis]